MKKLTQTFTLRNVAAATLLGMLIVCLTACPSDSGGGPSGPSGGGDPKPIKPGLYLKAPPITGDDTPWEWADGITPSQIVLASLIIINDVSPADEYTLVLDANTEEDPLVLEKSSLTIMSIGGERKISLNYSGALFTVKPGATLVLDKNITLTSRESVIITAKSMVEVQATPEGKGTLKMKPGSAIKGNKFDASTGGGVALYGGTFIMEGGEISGNKITTGPGAQALGGGVNVEFGTFTMNGGTISNNICENASNDGSSYIQGGGVYVNGTFTMTGGEISGNTAEEGGGVFVRAGTFTMTGGKISGNTASRDVDVAGDGGGVFVFPSIDGTSPSGTFIMEGGEISGNTAEYGGGVYSMGTFTMTDGEIFSNTAFGDGGGVVSLYGTFNLYRGEIFKNNAYNRGGGIALGPGKFVMTGGTIYGKNSDDKKNTTLSDGEGAAISMDSYCDAKYGKLNGSIFEETDDPPFSYGLWENTITVVDGILKSEDLE
jgi:hypothetical protein